MSASSFIKLPNHWYPLSFSKDLEKGEVQAVEVFGEPYVLFRNESGQVGLLEDRCPHRNVPLSEGFCDGGELRCAYHGWAFSPSGECTDIPCLARGFDGERRAAKSLPVRDDGCLIWGWPGGEPPGEEPRKPRSPGGDFSEVLHTVDMPGPLPAVIENALDVPHTRYLHAGMFRDDSSKNEIKLHISLDADKVEAFYEGEPRPAGIAGRILAPGGGIVEHWDRFIMPSTAEVEYRLGDHNHILISTVCCPVSESRTRLFAVVRFRTRLPDKLLRPAFMPIVRKILKQDADILKLQEANIQRFGEERFSSTELDAIGPRALYLLRAHQRGDEVSPKTFNPVIIYV
jgi:phenylpropionate dioxygenase-like ring-hydroxylating dioxygenase large terminal subunit